MNRHLAQCVAVLSVGLAAAVSASAQDARPKLLDLGSKACIPCKLMAPILDAMKAEFAGTLDVEFVDVGEKENLPLARQHAVKLIPTQVFLAPDGKELWRHEGFISRYGILAKWRELKYEFAAKALEPPFQRLEPAAADTRARDAICFMCDGDVGPKKVTVHTEKGDVSLCSMHHLFVMLSCLQKDIEATEASARVSDILSDGMLPVMSTVYLYGVDETTGRPWVRAFADRAAAEKDRTQSGGSIVSYAVLKAKELSARCGFCDRSVYPEDVAVVKIDGVHSWGCCAHCATGVASRTGKDIEVHERDRLTGEPVVVRTLGGYVSAIEPAGAVAWYGLRKKPDGAFGSAGCFHQGFFVSTENLRKWVEQQPLETGKQITIDQSLADKMAMTPQQIAKACKVGECSPK
jgi:thioredoxin 1